MIISNIEMANWNVMTTFLLCTPEVVFLPLLKRVSGLIPDKIYSYLYPEKVAAQSAANSLPTQEGKHKHHWSYNLDHWKNVIYLTPSEHRLAHYYIRYDQERMMYRRLDGTLLATKSEHLAYINGLFK